MSLHFGHQPVMGNPSLGGSHIKVSPIPLLLEQCHFAPWSIQCAKRDLVLILSEPRPQLLCSPPSLSVSLSLLYLCHLPSPRGLGRMGAQNLYKVNFDCKHNLNLTTRMSRARDVIQLVQCWPSMHEALHSIPNTA